MKYVVIFLVVFSFLFQSCQQKNYIYIVRHAEKSTEPSGDVYLSQAGRNRAHTLKSLLMRKHISYIFSTKTNRTRETAQPLSDEIGIPIKPYTNDTLPKFLTRCIRLRENMLIVGHSNTIITMLDSFHVTHTAKQFPETDYNAMFILTMKKGKVANFKETTYGKPGVGSKTN